MRKITATTADINEFANMARKVNFFNEMTVGLVEKIFSLVMLFEYKKGEAICKQGGPGDAFFLLYEGKLNVSIKTEGGFFGAEKKVAPMLPGEFFGEMALLDGSPRTATVECAEDSKVFVLLAAQFNEVTSGNPDFVDFLQNLAARRKFEENQ